MLTSNKFIYSYKNKRKKNNQTNAKKNGDGGFKNGLHINIWVLEKKCTRNTTEQFALKTSRITLRIRNWVPLRHLLPLLHLPPLLYRLIMVKVNNINHSNNKQLVTYVSKKIPDICPINLIVYQYVARTAYAYICRRLCAFGRTLNHNRTDEHAFSHAAKWITRNMSGHSIGAHQFALEVGMQCGTAPNRSEMLRRHGHCAATI